MLRLLALALALAVCVALGLPAFAQQAPPPTPPQSNLPHDAALNPAIPTLFVVGDSTARNSADLGWADHFAQFFDTSRINVANRAIAGRSARSYIDEGHWAATLAEMKPGDYLLLQMGHNDGGDLGGAKPRGDLKGIGDETADVAQTTGPFAGKIETIHTFGWYLRKMIDDAKAKGVHPILLTPTVRNIWKAPDGSPCGAPNQPACPAGSHIERDFGYNDFVRQVAAQEHIPILELGNIEADRLEALGPEKTAPLFPKDHTHTSATGAFWIADDVAQAIRKANLPLSGYLSKNPPVFVDMMSSMAADGSEDRTHERFVADRPQMESFAQQVLTDAQRGHRPVNRQAFVTRPLPRGIATVSVEDNVVIWPGGQPHFVLFTTFAGILNSFAGYVYSDSDKAPPKAAFTGEAFEVMRIAPHWYWWSSRN
ncbi:MAG TPA: rhamnogalacturonan acetylesterase [Acidobacteriaceae bacterium]|jgi:lysophospholipase L1-like esterase